MGHPFFNGVDLAQHNEYAPYFSPPSDSYIGFLMR